MNIFQKVIKVRKTCILQKDSKRSCYYCEYYLSCFSSKIIKYLPTDENIITVAKAIKEEKWQVK